MAWSMQAPLSAGRPPGTGEGATFCLARHLAPLEFLVSDFHQISVYLSQPLPVCAIPLYQTKPLHCKPISLGTPTFLPHPAVLYRILPYRAITPCPVVPCLAVPYLPISWNVLQYPILPHPAISCFLLPSTYTCQDGSTPTCSHFSLTG